MAEVWVRVRGRGRGRGRGRVRANPNPNPHPHPNPNPNSNPNPSLHGGRAGGAGVEEEEDREDDEDAHHLEGEEEDAAGDLARARGLQHAEAEVEQQRGAEDLALARREHGHEEAPPGREGEQHDHEAKQGEEQGRLCQQVERVGRHAFLRRRGALDDAAARAAAHPRAPRGGEERRQAERLVRQG